MTTPKAILIGLSFIAIAIASIPYSNNVITPAFANIYYDTKVGVCGEMFGCAHTTYTKDGVALVVKISD